MTVLHSTAASSVCPADRHHHNLTEHFTIFEPPNPEIDEFYVVQKRCPTDFEAPKLRIIQSGICFTSVHRIDENNLIESQITHASITHDCHFLSMGYFAIFRY